MIIMTESRAIGERKLGWFTLAYTLWNLGQIISFKFFLWYWAGSELSWLAFLTFYNFFYIISYLALWQAQSLTQIIITASIF